MKHILRRVYYFLPYAISKYINLIIMKFKHVKCGKNLKIRGILYIKNGLINPFTKNKNIIIGDNVRINSSRASNPIGGQTKTIINVSKNGKVIIGQGTGISNTAIVSHNNIKIGNNVFIGSGCKIYDTDFHSIYSDNRLNNNIGVKTKPISIGDEVFIGSHCIILKGVTIGEKSVIGAGSVVTKDIPKGEVWGGNPAQFIKKI